MGWSCVKPTPARPGGGGGIALASVFVANSQTGATVIVMRCRNVGGAAGPEAGACAVFAAGGTAVDAAGAADADDIGIGICVGVAEGSGSGENGGTVGAGGGVAWASAATEETLTAPSASAATRNP